MESDELDTVDSFEFYDPVPNSITLRTGPEEMIRVDRDGFYVRGQRVWLRRIYRRAYEKTYVTYDDWTHYQYGSLLDVLANPDQLGAWWSNG